MARSQHLAAIHVVCLAVAFIAHRRFRNRNRLPSRAEMLHRQKVREELLHSLSTSEKCRKLIRMSEDAFMTLYQKLQNEGGLKPTQRMSIEEQVARFLHIVGNDLKATFVSWLYRRSESATSRHFHRVMNAIKEHFAHCYDIFRGASLSGFSWNPNTKLMEAEDEVWEALIKEKPEAEKWRTKQISHYNEMLELFAKDRATGFAAETAKDKRNRVNNNDQKYETIDEIDQSLGTNEISLENFNSGEEIHVTSTTPPSQVKLQSKLSSKCKKRKLEKLEEENAYASMIMSSINNVANALDRNTKVSNVTSVKISFNKILN